MEAGVFMAAVTVLAAATTHRVIAGSTRRRSWPPHSTTVTVIIMTTASGATPRSAVAGSTGTETVGAAGDGSAGAIAIDGDTSRFDGMSRRW